MLGDFGQRDGVQFGQGVLRIHHPHELVAVDRVRLHAGGFDRQRDDADVDGAVLELLENLVAEVAVDAHLHAGIQAAVLREDVGKNVEAGGLVGADDDRAARVGAVVGDSEQRFVAQLQQALGVGEQDAAGGSQRDVFAGAVEKAVAVVLLELPDLRADGGLRAKNFLAGARKAS